MSQTVRSIESERGQFGCRPSLAVKDDSGGRSDIFRPLRIRSSIHPHTIHARAGLSASLPRRVGLVFVPVSPPHLLAPCLSTSIAISPGGKRSDMKGWRRGLMPSRTLLSTSGNRPARVVSDAVALKSFGRKRKAWGRAASEFLRPRRIQP